MPRSKTLSIARVRMLEGAPDVDLDTVGSTKVGEMMVEVIDPVEDYLKVRAMAGFEGVARLLRAALCQTSRSDHTHT